MTELYESEQRSDLVIEINGPDLSAEQLAVARQSVETMARRSIEMRDRARAKDAELARASEVVNRPLMAAFERDTAAAGELESVLKQAHLMPDPDLTAFTDPDPSTPRFEDTVAGDPVLAQAERPPLTVTAGVQVPPFDFDWIWRRQDGSPPTISLADRTTGRVLLQGSSGPLVPPHGSGKFVEVHAGCGLLTRATGNGTLIGVSSQRFARFYYWVAAYGLGSNATTEGGTECTILENGQLKRTETRRKWRKRVSVDEHDEFQSNLFGDGPMRLEMPARAGAEYTFNVGLWLYVDNTSGVGQSGSLARASLEIPSLEIIRL